MPDLPLFPDPAAERKRREFHEWALRMERALNPEIQGITYELPDGSIEILWSDGSTSRGGRA